MVEPPGNGGMKSIQWRERAAGHRRFAVPIPAVKEACLREETSAQDDMQLMHGAVVDQRDRGGAAQQLAV